MHVPSRSQHYGAVEAAGTGISMPPGQPPSYMMPILAWPEYNPDNLLVMSPPGVWADRYNYSLATTFTDLPDQSDYYAYAPDPMPLPTTSVAPTTTPDSLLDPFNIPRSFLTPTIGSYELFTAAYAHVDGEGHHSMSASNMVQPVGDVGASPWAPSVTASSSAGVSARVGSSADARPFASTAADPSGQCVLRFAPNIGTPAHSEFQDDAPLLVSHLSLNRGAAGMPDEFRPGTIIPLSLHHAPRSAIRQPKQTNPWQDPTLGSAGVPDADPSTTACGDITHDLSTTACTVALRTPLSVTSGQDASLRVAGDLHSVPLGPSDAYVPIIAQCTPALGLSAACDDRTTLSDPLSSPPLPSNRRKVERVPTSDDPLPNSSPRGIAADSAKPKKNRHACEHCNKSFDRPSTLKKHSVVHTRVKDYKCARCERSFNVRSNLNRHGARCKSRSSTSSSTRSTMSKPSSPTATASSSDTSPSQLGIEQTPTAGTVHSTASTVAATTTSKKRQRPRNENVAAWVPASLKSFDLSGANCEPAAMPLPPVKPYTIKVADIPGNVDEVAEKLSGLRIVHEADGPYVVEERDSYDQNMHPTPYHPKGWTGRLPGPRASVDELGRPEVMVSNQAMQTQRRCRL